MISVVVAASLALVLYAILRTPRLPPANPDRTETVRRLIRLDAIVWETERALLAELDRNADE